MLDSKVEKLIADNSSTLQFGSSYHGKEHWAKVERNGHYLAQFNDADKMVISYFAFVHDSMREDDGEDLGHGPRAAAFIMKHRDVFPLDDSQFQQLKDACKGHTVGEKPDCVTINTCWDADRLDIGRVGVTPNSKYLFSEEAKRIADEGDYGALDNYKIEGSTLIEKVVIHALSIFTSASIIYIILNDKPWPESVWIDLFVLLFAIPAWYFLYKFFYRQTLSIVAD